MMNKKRAMALGLLLLSLTGIGGTLAYLTSEASDVNVFTLGKIDFTLTETDTEVDADDDVTTNTYEIKAAGQLIEKDPKITIQPGCAVCWLFVELEKQNDFDNFLEYTIADGWTALETEGETDVYYRIYDEKLTEEQKFSILKNDTVMVRENVRPKELNDLTAETYPKLIVHASAIQYSDGEGDLGTPESAWALLQAEQKSEEEG